MPERILPLLCFLLTLQAAAQRQWGLSDSTHYTIGGDTTLIASRHHLYRALPGDTVLLRDFTDVEEPNRFIRDVDHWTSDHLAVVVGNRYIGHSTALFVSSDAGATWNEDTTFFATTMHPPSINQLAIVGDTTYLFNGYYQTEILRSFDRGASWQHWIHSLIAHYYGIIPCGSSAYIFGMIGDGFAPSMWRVPDTLWQPQSAYFWSGCHNGNTPGCYYAPDPNYANVVAYFDSVSTTLCDIGTQISVHSTIDRPRIVPNPVRDRFAIQGLDDRAVLRLTDPIGRDVAVRREANMIAIGDLPAGLYVLHVISDGVGHALRLVKE